jgi:hypothetical protein
MQALELHQVTFFGFGVFVIEVGLLSRGLYHPFRAGRWTSCIQRLHRDQSLVGKVGVTSLEDTDDQQAGCRWGEQGTGETVLIPCGCSSVR